MIPEKISKGAHLNILEETLKTPGKQSTAGISEINPIGIPEGNIRKILKESREKSLVEIWKEFLKKSRMEFQEKSRNESP